MSAASAQIYTDGAARGNPGPAAIAFVITRDGQPAHEEAHCLGHATNNVAEYTALVQALERAAQLGLKKLVIHSDSELMVKQMNGVYKVKNADLQVLFEQAKELRRRFDNVTIRHVRREQNSRADHLCNLALDGQPIPAPEIPPQVKPVAADSEQAVRDEALNCLRTAAQAWARGKADEPSVEAVWEQLHDILKKHGQLR